MDIRFNGVPPNIVNYSNGTMVFVDNSTNNYQTEPPPQTRQEFELPINSETLRISCSGPSLYTGLLKIQQSDTEISDSAQVKVVVTRYHHDIPKITATKIEEEELVCIDISTPEQPFMSCMTCSRTAIVEITICLPQGTHSDPESPLKIRNFEAHLGVFNVYIDDIMDSVEFQTFDLSTGKGDVIHVAGIQVTQGRIQAGSGNIFGHFSATSKLSLKATSGNVHAQSVVLENTKPNRAATLTLEVMNGTATAESVSLLSDLSSGGDFSLTVSSNSGNAFCFVVYAPIDAAIDMKTYCNGGHSRATLPSTYEGTFDVRTTFGHLSFDSGNPNESDPEGTNQKRQVQFRRSVNYFPIGGERSGWVFRSRDGKQRGSAEVWSDTGSASLSL
ncbi:hypothetical protein K435DRAFT_895985 [Dendrothele bispora CBS 962.96]|uniref:DUF4097 domain-containing protein n=1 Tax=Dendrothele bispora (strain CBS 962.96) TaxID=1314807 RepID=A0A4S8M1C1_DENBC|nr:hypothetical protein K435DRAFT_895985 [Dendrothele bispora CBS 962.96]